MKVKKKMSTTNKTFLELVWGPVCEMSLLKNCLCVHNPVIHSHYPDISCWLLFNYHDLQHSHTSPLSQNLITAAPVVAAAEWGASLRWMVVIFTFKGPRRMKDWLTDGLRVRRTRPSYLISAQKHSCLCYVYSWAGVHGKLANWDKCCLTSSSYL